MKHLEGDTTVVYIICQRGCTDSVTRQALSSLRALVPPTMHVLLSAWFSAFNPSDLKACVSGTSLVAQWLRIHLPTQGTRVRSLVQEDPTCHGATKPMCHNYWACALEPTSHNYWACEPQLLKPTRLEPVLLNKRSHCNEKTAHHSKE